MSAAIEAGDRCWNGEHQRGGLVWGNVVPVFEKLNDWEFINRVLHGNAMLIEHLLQVVGQIESPGAERGGKHNGDISVFEMTRYVAKSQAVLQHIGK